MKTQIAHRAGKMVVVTGLAAALTIGGLRLTTAEHADKDNYFVQHPGPASGHTGLDVHDPYAPIDLSPVLLASGFTATEITGGWDVPPSPGKPGKPY